MRVVSGSGGQQPGFGPLRSIDRESECDDRDLTLTDANSSPSLMSSSASVLSLLYQDDHYVAINKPAGLLVHRTKIDRYETRFALQMLRDQLGEHVFPIHRLDKPTSGVLVFGRTPHDAAALAARFDVREVEKQYLAIVRGYVNGAGRIVHAISTERGTQEAITAYRRLATVELPYAVGRYATARYSLVLAMPETGRTHQLRRHFKHIFHPIIGDRKYGDDRHTRFFEAEFGCYRLLLHATALRFRHPFKDDDVMISAPMDDPFVEVLESMTWIETVEEIRSAAVLHGNWKAQ
jgi:tRNA pseudouridine65 synthase